MSEAKYADYKAHCTALVERFGGLRPHPKVRYGPKPVKEQRPLYRDSGLCWRQRFKLASIVRGC